MTAQNRTTAEPAGREFAFSARDFGRVRELIHERAGIALATSKQDMVYSRLSRLLRALGLSSFSEYLGRLDSPDEPEWEAFTNALTTNLTSFFREAHHFDQLRELLSSNPRQGTQRIWCAAASTGEEPYSLAISACEAFDTLQPPVRILATDLDTQVLETGSRGVYSMDRVERMDPALVRRYFRRGTGSAAGLCKVRDELRALIEFRQLNLLDERYPMRGPFDAIFCRNVMIYFDKPTQRAVLQRIMPLLSADGLFFAGHSESFFHAADLVASCGRTVYRHAVASSAGRSN